jgi:hypothetical protein
MTRGRKKTTAGRIRDCLKAVRFWDKHPVTIGGETSRAVFVKAIKAHLKNADEHGESIPDELLAKALKVVGV